VDELPTNLLGQTAPRFSLSDERQQPIQPASFARQQTVWLWLDGHSESPKLIEQFQKIQREVSASAAGRNTEFVIVIGRGGIESNAGGRFHVTRTLRPAINLLQGSLKTLYDGDRSAEKALEIHSTPAVLITDPNLTIQYASELSESKGYNGIPEIDNAWPEQLAAASQAVANGKDVASSMLDNYRTLLNRYFGDMDSVSVASWFPGFTPAGRKSIAAIPAKTDIASGIPGSAKASGIKLRPTLLWESNQIRRAGNVFPLMDSRGLNSLMVFDGWQTIRQFSPDGKFIGEKALDIPANQAVTSWRNARSKTGETLNVFYSIGGPRVWVFNQQMQSKFTLPATDEKPAKVLDIQVIQNSGQDDQLLVSFRDIGQVLINPFSGKSKSLDRNPVRSSAISGQDVAQIGIDGTLVGRKEQDPSTIEYMHLVPALGRGNSKFAAAGISQQGQWLIAGFDRDFKKRWEYSIGAVRFENGTQPVTSAAAPSGDTIWSVADENNRIYCLDADGNWLGDFDAGAEVRGLRLVSHREKLLLVVAMASKIECWDLQLQ